jgi:hypothetical protein
MAGMSRCVGRRMMVSHKHGYETLVNSIVHQLLGSLLAGLRIITICAGMC